LTSLKVHFKKYNASGANEYFISIEDAKHCCAFLRLRFPKQQLLDALKGCAMIRELHVYGQMVPTTKKSGYTQHSGFGTRLLARAEWQAKIHGYRYIAVISGVGTRQYYAKRGYKLENEHNYMKKYIGHEFDTFMIVLYSISLFYMTYYFRSTLT
jgi:elongator complex protein 3